MIKGLIALVLLGIANYSVATSYHETEDQQKHHGHKRKAHQTKEWRKPRKKQTHENEQPEQKQVKTHTKKTKNQQYGMHKGAPIQKDKEVEDAQENEEVEDTQENEEVETGSM
jgi:hypothetical protein